MLAAAAVVVCALDLLGRSSGSTIPIRLLDTAPAGASAGVEAFVTRNPDTIFLITSSEVFRTAQRGYAEPGAPEACRKIASIIVHEEWHLLHGADEENAYLAQLTALKMLGAESATMVSVRLSMTAVLAEQRRRAAATRRLAASLRAGR